MPKIPSTPAAITDRSLDRDFHPIQKFPATQRSPQPTPHESLLRPPLPELTQKSNISTELFVLFDEKMKPEIILCIPGPWDDRRKLLEDIIVRTEGKFMFAGGILACASAKDHVPLDYESYTPEMGEAFQCAGQGKIFDETLNAISHHKGVAYLHFPLEFIAQRERIKMFTSILRDCGGIGIKNESSGIAHEWDRWFELIESENLFDAYCACIVLVADDDVYYSCGMHHFSLPEVQISRDFGIQEAAKFINDFNLYQLTEEPNIADGHTFSLTPDGPKFRIEHVADDRHEPDDLFHNSAGVWSLERVEQCVPPNV